MSYTPTTWVNGQPPALNAENLNKIEQGIVKLDEDVDDVKKDLTSVVKTIKGLNLYDENSNLVIGYAMNSDGSFGETTLFKGYATIPIKQGKYYQVIRFDDNGNASIDNGNWKISDINGNTIRVYASQTLASVNYQQSHSTEPTAILNFNVRKNYPLYMVVELDAYTTSLAYSTYSSPLRRYNSAIDWVGKKWVTYGDSFVEQGNGNSLTNGWQKYVNRYMGFSKHYGRGIGGSSFQIGDKAYYVDDNGIPSSSGNLIHGGMCAWDRITHMIPPSIKDDVDLIFVLGGNNDYSNYFNPDNTTWKTWSASNTTDAEWIAYCTENGLDVGDYPIAGNVRASELSMIMKLQTWCPNAVIVICGGSPTYGEQGKNAHAPYEKTVSGLTHTMQDIRDAVKEVADYASIPYVDIYSNMGVNFMNRASYSSDNIHPNEEGRKMLARVICGALKTVLPRDAFNE